MAKRLERVWGGRIRAKTKKDIKTFYKKDKRFSIDSIKMEKNSKFAGCSVYKVWLKKKKK